MQNLAFPLLAPAIMAAIATLLLRHRPPAAKGQGVAAELAAGLALVVSCGAALQLALVGPATLTLASSRGLGLSVRLELPGV